jgi:hypothetical protein
VTPLELIWNGWRAEYVGGAHDTDLPGSVFTQILASGLSDEDSYIVHCGMTVFALLNAPRTPPDTMVVPYRETADLESLTLRRPRSLVDRDGRRCHAEVGVPPGWINVGLNSPPAAASASTSTSTCRRAKTATATS